jgi:hypothetical protein
MEGTPPQPILPRSTGGSPVARRNADGRAAGRGPEAADHFGPTPTDASYLDPIETHFRTIRRWAFLASNCPEGGDAEAALRLVIRRFIQTHLLPDSRSQHRWGTTRESLRRG